MKKRRKQGNVLLLNASYEPLCTIGAARAVSQIRRGRAHAVEIGAEVLRSAHHTFEVPSVVRLKHYVNVRGKQVRAIARSRTKILARDNHQCQFCGAHGTDFTLTLDHVIPRSRGGASVPENLVAACKPCNQRKGNRTPEEAGMLLLSDPRAMGDNLDMIYLWRIAHRSRPEWVSYIEPFVKRRAAA